MKSDKFVTIGITATKDMRKAFEELRDTDVNSKSFKVLFERMLIEYVYKRIDMYRERMKQAETDLKNIGEDIAALQGELANETDSERSQWLASKLETYREMERQFLENRVSNKMLFERYQRIYETAAPCQNYPADIDDQDVLFAGLNCRLTDTTRTIQNR